MGSQLSNIDIPWQNEMMRKKCSDNFGMITLKNIKYFGYKGSVTEKSLSGHELLSC